jgi:hypothetical protein
MAAGRGKKCFFCKTGKKSGLNVLTAFICLDCEREIAALSLDDLKYRSYMRDIKRFWNGLQGEERVF